MKFFLILLFVSSINSFAFHISDIDIPVKLYRKAKQPKTYTINCGYLTDPIIKKGLVLSVFRNNSKGISSQIGLLKIISVGDYYSKAIVYKCSETLPERNIEIENFSINDLIYPSVIFLTKDIFKNLNSSNLSAKGIIQIKNKLFDLKTNFNKIKIFASLDRHYNSDKEIIMSEKQASTLKKHLIQKYGFIETGIEIIASGNLQKLYKKKKNLNSRLELLFERFILPSIQEVKIDTIKIDNIKVDSVNIVKKDSLKNIKGITNPKEIDAPPEIILK